jgi:hypothetical protein
MAFASLLADTGLRRLLLAGEDVRPLEDRNLVKRISATRQLLALVDDAQQSAVGDARLQLLLIRGHLASLESVLMRQRAQLHKPGVLQERAGIRDLSSLHAIEREHRQALQHAAEGIALQKNLSQLPQSIIAIAGKIDHALGRRE